MSKRFCKCPNEHCFDRAIQCGSCDPEDLDSEGYPRSKARRRLTNEENGMVQDVDDKQWFKVKKVKGGKRLVPQFNGPVDWKSAKGFSTTCLLLSCLGAEGEYVLWNEATGEEMTEKEWKRWKYTSSSRPPIRHRLCDTAVSGMLMNLRAGKHVACFCSGKMSLDDPQYYDKMVDPVVCHRLGCFAAFHRADNPLTPPPKEAFYSAIALVAEGECRSNVMLDCHCARCDTTASSTLHDLRSGQGVPCFCSKNMPLDDPLYYDKMIDPVVCNRLGWYKAFHHKDACLTPPSRDVFYSAIVSMGKAKDRSQAMLECHCVRCNTTAAATINNLQKTGIACFCSGKMSWLHPRYYDKMIDPVICKRLGCFAAFHRADNPLTPPCKEAFYTSVAASIAKGNRAQTMIECHCTRCDISASSQLNSLQQGNGIMCNCRNKTENKLHEWLKKRFLDLIIDHGKYRGPGRTHFDFHLRFSDGFEVIIELDGAQHFWERCDYYTDEGCERDLAKEEWAIAKGLSVVRVLQEDVWNDLNGWQGWLTKSIEAARSGEPRVFIPIAPEYRSDNSAYAQLRPPG